MFTDGWAAHESLSGICKSWDYKCHNFIFSLCSALKAIVGGAGCFVVWFLYHVGGLVKPWPHESRSLYCWRANKTATPNTEIENCGLSYIYANRENDLFVPQDTLVLHCYAVRMNTLRNIVFDFDFENCLHQFITHGLVEHSNWDREP
jgi:hypothetical protein